MPPYEKLKRPIFILAAALILVLAVNILVSAIITSNEKKHARVEAEKFISLIEKGRYMESAELWPSVYQTMKSDESFPDSFEKALIENYGDYYDLTYLQNKPDNGLFEICRVYNAFLDVSHVETLADSVYDDYISEQIGYDTFVKAVNDLYFFTQYESDHIGYLLEKGLIVLKSRELYLKALALEADGDYITAVELLRSVSTLDTAYYPVALEKIDALIMKIRDSVKNGD